MRLLFLILTLLAMNSYAQPLKIITSIKPLALIAKDIAGNRAEVDYLVPNEGSIHHYSMRVSDRILVDRADILLLVGAGLEPFNNKLREVKVDILSIDQLTGIETLALEEDDHGHADHDIDPHLWLSPHNAVLLAIAVAERLASLDPTHADDYLNRAALFEDRSHQQLAVMPTNTNFHFYTYHNALAYLFVPLGIENQASMTSSNETGIGMRSLYRLKKQLAADSNACVLVSHAALEKTRKQLGPQVQFATLDLLADKAEYSSYQEYLAAMINSIISCH